MDYEDKFRVGRQYILDIHVNSPIYCKCELMDMKSLEFHRRFSSSMITVTKNHFCESLGAMRLKIFNRNGSSLLHSNHAFWTHRKLLPKCTKPVANDVMNDLKNILEQYV